PVHLVAGEFDLEPRLDDWVPPPGGGEDGLGLRRHAGVSQGQRRCGVAASACLEGGRGEEGSNHCQGENGQIASGAQSLVPSTPWARSPWAEAHLGIV